MQAADAVRKEGTTIDLTQRSRLTLLILVLLACGATLTIYHATIAHGFFYDDYHFVRPYQTAEVRGSFAGTWDASRIEVPFYRPLTILFFAARFRLLGFHAAWYHWLSLLLFALVATLAGLFVRRVTGRASYALLATAVVCVHPAMVQSLTAWITNQMHLVEALIVLTAYLAWYSACRGRPASWRLVAVLSCAGLFVKEDAAMLPITVLAMHGLYRRFVDPSVRPAPRWFVAASFLVPAVFMGVRHAMLGGLGGYGRPTVAVGASRIESTVLSVVLQSWGRRPIQHAITYALEVLLPLGGLIAVVRGGIARFVVLAGLGVLLCFSLPFAFATKAQQVHLAALGTCLLMTGALVAIAAVLSHRLLRAGYWLAVVALIGAMGWVSRADVAGLAADAPYTLATDRIVQTWPAVVPEEIKQMLGRKLPGQPPLRVDALPIIMCGVGETQPANDGPAVRWSGGTIEMFTSAARGSIALRIRTLIMPATGRTVVRVRVDAQGFASRQFVLADEAWKSVSIPFARQWFLPAGAPTVRLVVDPTFEPAKVFKNGDTRTLGIQIADVQVH